MNRLPWGKAILELQQTAFVHLAETGVFSDDQIARCAAAFPLWTKYGTYEKGSVVRCPNTGNAFRCKRVPKVAAVRVDDIQVDTQLGIRGSVDIAPVVQSFATVAVTDEIALMLDEPKPPSKDKGNWTRIGGAS